MSVAECASRIWPDRLASLRATSEQLAEAPAPLRPRPPPVNKEEAEGGAPPAPPRSVPPRDRRGLVTTPTITDAGRQRPKPAVARPSSVVLLSWRSGSPGASRSSPEPGGGLRRLVPELRKEADHLLHKSEKSLRQNGFWWPPYLIALPKWLW